MMDPFWKFSQCSDLELYSPHFGKDDRQQNSKSLISSVLRRPDSRAMEEKMSQKLLRKTDSSDPSIHQSFDPTPIHCEARKFQSDGSTNQHLVNTTSLKMGRKKRKQQQHSTYQSKQEFKTDLMNRSFDINHQFGDQTSQPSPVDEEKPLFTNCDVHRYQNETVHPVDVVKHTNGLKTQMTSKRLHYFNSPTLTLDSETSSRVVQSTVQKPGRRQATTSKKIQFNDDIEKWSRRFTKDTMELSQQHNDCYQLETYESEDNSVDRRQQQLCSVVDHGAWYNIGKKKKKKVLSTGSSIGLETRSAANLDTQSMMSEQSEGKSSEARTVTLGEMVQSNYLLPPPKKNKKSWDSKLWFGGSSKKQKDKNKSHTLLSKSLSMSGSDFTMHSAAVNPQQVALRRPSDVASLRSRQSDESVVSGYTGLSGVSGKPVSDFGGAVAKAHEKKKKTLLQKIFGPSSTSKKNTNDGSHLNLEILAQIDSDYRNSATKDRPLPSLSEAGIAFPTETSEKRLERIWHETREDFLHVLKRVQERFITRQMQEDVIRTKLKQRQQDALKETGMEGPQSLITDKDTLGFTTISYNPDAKDTSFLYDLTAVNWPGVEAQSQSDVVRMTFVLNKFKTLINGMFDDEQFNTAIIDLEQAEMEQKTRWINEDRQQMGDLVKGKLVLDQLHTRIAEAEDFHKREVYRKVEILTSEVNQLRSRLHRAVSDGFDSYKSASLENSSFKAESCRTPNVTTTFQSSLSEHEKCPFIMPKFLQKAIRLSDLWKENSEFTKTQIKMSDGLNSQIQQERQEIQTAMLYGLGKAVKSKRAPVGEGFLVVSSREDFLSMEKKLDGKWGSYRIFEKWLHEALRWQWLDFQFQKDLSTRQIDIQQLAEKKKHDFLKAIDIRLAQLWMGRVTEDRRTATLRLADLLEESITARKPLFVAPTSVEMEKAKMEMEDQRSLLERFVKSTIGREILKQQKKEKASKSGVLPITLTSPNDITSLIEDAERIRYALLKDSSLIDSLNVQTRFVEQRETITQMAKTIKVVEKDFVEREKKVLKDKKELDDQYNELAKKLAHEREKESAIVALRNEVEAVKSNVANLTEEVAVAKVKTISLEKERIELKETRKKKEADSYRLERHLREETKKHQKLLESIEQERTGRRTSESVIGGLFKGWNKAPSVMNKKRSDSIISSVFEAPHYGETRSEFGANESVGSSYPGGVSERGSVMGEERIYSVSVTPPTEKKKKTMFQKLTKVIVGGGHSSSKPPPRSKSIASIQRDSETFDSRKLTAGVAFDRNLSDIGSALPSESTGEPKGFEHNPLGAASSRTSPEIETMMIGGYRYEDNWTEHSEPVIRLQRPPESSISPAGSLDHLPKVSALSAESLNNMNEAERKLISPATSPQKPSPEVIQPSPRRTHVMSITEPTPPGPPLPATSVVTSSIKPTQSKPPLPTSLVPTATAIVSSTGIHPAETAIAKPDVLKYEDACSVEGTSLATGSDASGVEQLTTTKEKKKKKGGIMSLFKSKKKSTDKLDKEQSNRFRTMSIESSVISEDFQRRQTGSLPDLLNQNSKSLHHFSRSPPSMLSDLEKKVTEPTTGYENEIPQTGKLGKSTSTVIQERSLALTSFADIPHASLMHNDTPIGEDAETMMKNKSMFHKLAGAISCRKRSLLISKRSHNRKHVKSISSKLSSNHILSTVRHNSIYTMSIPSCISFGSTALSERPSISANTSKNHSLNETKKEEMDEMLQTTIALNRATDRDAQSSCFAVFNSSSSNSSSVAECQIPRVHSTSVISPIRESDSKTSLDNKIIPSPLESRISNTQLASAAAKKPFQLPQWSTANNRIDDDDADTDHGRSLCNPFDSFESLGPQHKERRWSHHSTISVMDLPLAAPDSKDTVVLKPLSSEVELPRTGALPTSSLRDKSFILKHNIQQPQTLGTRQKSSGPQGIDLEKPSGANITRFGEALELSESSLDESLHVNSFKPSSTGENGISGPSRLPQFGYSSYGESDEELKSNQIDLKKQESDVLIHDLDTSQNSHELDSYQHSQRTIMADLDDSESKRKVLSSITINSERNESAAIENLKPQAYSKDKLHSEDEFSLKDHSLKHLSRKPQSLSDDLVASDNSGSAYAYVPFTIQVTSAVSDDDASVDESAPRKPEVLITTNLPLRSQETDNSVETTTMQILSKNLQPTEGPQELQMTQPSVTTVRQLDSSFAQQSESPLTDSKESCSSGMVQREQDQIVTSIQDQEAMSFYSDRSSNSSSTSLQSTHQRLSYSPWNSRSVSQRVAQLQRDEHGCLDLSEVLAATLLAKSLTFEEVKRTATLMSSVQLPANQDIFSQFESADVLYIIHDGEVVITNEAGTILDRLTNGALIFDRQFVKGQPCPANAVTSKATSLYKMTRRTFANAIRDGQERIAMTLSQYLMKELLLGGLKQHEAESLARLAYPNYYTENEHIINEDDPANAFFIILNGSCLSVRRDDALTDQYHPGDVFGLESLAGEPYSESVLVRSPEGASLAIFTPQQLESIVGDLPIFFQRQQSSVSNLDQCVTSMDSISNFGGDNSHFGERKKKKKKLKLKSGFSKVFGKKRSQKSSSSLKGERSYQNSSEFEKSPI